jgi:hypothetical protein
MKSAILIVLSLMTVAASAEPYADLNALLQAFFKAGFTEIVDVPGSSYSDDTIVVHVPGAEGAQTMTLQKFSKSSDSEVRVPAFDYIEASPLVGGPHIGEAYVVADRFLCYKLNASWFRHRQMAGKYLRCLTFPQSVSEVLAQVERSKSN